jgi:hypothetical protein
LSLFDYSGVWSAPYHKAGYKTTQVDIKHGDDVLDITEAWLDKVGKIHGILAAPPCTHFCVSGARHFSSKDKDGRTSEGLKLLHKTMWIIQKTDPKWWVIENPVGRINRLFPEMEYFGPSYFQPWQYGDPYTKKTGLWGKFKMPPVRNPVRPIMYTNSKGQKGSWMWAKLGGNSEKTKELRSLTPAGFAQAFFEANP